MIDYLEDLLEEEGAVELAGRPLLPVGRRKGPLWEEEESSLRENRGLAGEDFSDRSFWGEEGMTVPSGAVRLLEELRRAELAAGAIRHQGNPVTVTLPEEGIPRGGLDLERIDRAVQRDARRYDGGFSLY